MPNYKIEGNIDFYTSLYSSLDYDSEQDLNQGSNHTPVCEITGTKLTTHFVTLECKHTFNYDALYTEICKQKYDFQSYTTDVLSKTDIQKIRDKKLDYYIKCPYCRHIQFDLLPFHDDLPFQKKYGVNTADPDFKVVKTSYIPSTVPGNYTFHIYGYQFTKGICCKPNTCLASGKVIPCYNTYATSIVAPDGSTKLFCPNHVRVEVKAFKLEIKKKEIEDKLLAKAEAKQKALISAAKSAAEKMALKSAAKSTEKKTKVAKPKVAKDPTLCLNCSCTALLKTGLRKGQACGQKVFSDLNVNEKNLCKRHQPKLKSPPSI
jgi:hypothetical protein